MFKMSAEKLELTIGGLCALGALSRLLRYGASGWAGAIDVLIVVVVIIGAIAYAILPGSDHLERK